MTELYRSRNYYSSLGLEVTVEGNNSSFDDVDSLKEHLKNEDRRTDQIFMYLKEDVWEGVESLKSDLLPKNGKIKIQKSNITIEYGSKLIFYVLPDLSKKTIKSYIFKVLPLMTKEGIIVLPENGEKTHEMKRVCIVL